MWQIKDIIRKISDNNFINILLFPPHLISSLKFGLFSEKPKQKLLKDISNIILYAKNKNILMK